MYSTLPHFFLAGNYSAPPTWAVTINQGIVNQAVIALAQGNAAEIGALMNQAQAEFDRYVAPACPEQLNAPLLHELLRHPPLQPYVYGGKGIGSQGDGTAQFMVRDYDSQMQALAVVKQDFPQMECYPLDIPKQILNK